jgi:magnesium chelatase family protein
MHVLVSQLSPALLLNQKKEKAESSATVRERVLLAREKQMMRAKCTNAQLIGEAVIQHCSIAEKDFAFLENALLKLGLSARAYHRILKLSRTIADLDNSDHITQHHLQEALSYRLIKNVRV